MSSRSWSRRSSPATSSSSTISAAIKARLCGKPSAPPVQSYSSCRPTAQISIRSSSSSPSSKPCSAKLQREQSRQLGGASAMPLAFTALDRINDFSGAEVANELVEAVPANGSFRYWRAMAYDRTGKFSQAMVDYMNAIQLAGDSKRVPGDVFYKWAQSYAALGRYCDAISPIEMYISLGPAKRRTPQTTKIISDYAEKGDCDKRYPTGTARVPFAVGLGVRTLNVVVNNVAGTLILDTGA